MERLRARLRGCAEAVVALVETVIEARQASHDAPLTPEDGCKTVRLMRQADAMVCQLYATPESVVRSVSTSRPAPVTAAAAPVTPAPPQTKAPPRPGSWAAELARINEGYYDYGDGGDDEDDDIPQPVRPEIPVAPAPVEASTPPTPPTQAPSGGEPTQYRNPIISNRPLTGPYRRQSKPPD